MHPERNLDSLFDQARAPKQLLSAESVDAVSTQGEEILARRDSSTGMNGWMATLLMVMSLATAAVIALDRQPDSAATAGAATAPLPDSLHIVTVVGPDGADTLRITVLSPNALYDSADAQRRSRAMNYAMNEVTTVTLGERELARIGIRRIDRGIVIFARLESGAVEATEVSIEGTAFRYRITPDDTAGISIPDVQYTVVTTEDGLWRTHRYDDEVVAPDLVRERNRHAPGSPGYTRLSDAIARRATEHTINRLDSLIPIRIDVDVPRPHDTSRSWGVSSIVWFEPEPQLLALLPQRVVAAVQAKGLTRHPVAPDANRTKNRSRSPQESHTRSRTGQANDTASTGTHPATDSTALRPTTDDRVITNLRITPSPVQAGAAVRFDVAVPTTAEITVHDLRGTPVLVMPRINCARTGEWQVAFDAGALRPGMYVLIIQVASGQMFTRTFVVGTRART